MNIEQLIRNLEAYWDPGCFFEAVRRGRFNPRDGDAFLELLRSISLKDEELVPKRLISLLWYLPSFLEWQKERVAEVANSEVPSYEHFITEVLNILEEVLGVP